MERRIVNLSEYFTGLQRDGRDRYSKHFDVCRGLKAEPFGLTVLETVTAPDAETVSWPFPQLLYGGSYLKCEAAEIGIFSSLMVPSTQDVYALGNLSSSWALAAASGSITSGGVWQIARNDKAWFLFNGSCVVFYLPSYGTFPGAMFASVSPFANCGTSYNGRFVFGGLGSFISSGFNTALSSWLDSTVSGLAPGNNWIWYSDVGGEDVWYYFFPWMCDETKYQELMKRNVAGFMVMPFDGKVLAVKQLGNGLMVYGEDGVCFLSPDSSGHFAVTLLPIGGIMERGAVGGSIAQHLFVDVHGDAYTIDSQQKLEKIGCNDYLEDLDNFIVSYDGHRGDFYVSGQTAANSVRCYLFSSAGVTELLSGYTGLCRISDSLYGYGKSGYAGANSGIYLSLGPLLFDSHEEKTLQALRLVTTNPTKFKVYVRTRQSPVDAWGTYSTALAFNQNGWANLGITGREFYITLTALDTDYATTLDVLSLEAVIEDGGRVNLGSMLS